jgi:hypothetical protein
MHLGDLHHEVRATYRSAMQQRGGTREAFRECVAVIRKHRPDWPEKDARAAVAKMIAREPDLLGGSGLT